ncbi:MAG: hypothetical protein N2323_02090 [candidate division WOR-3 bacterium]|nr:hypothetical protein [candidate division WOR-3 bacterium]MCX7836738.1 hypothetical protein [candidate division WOR-3 bacterium]MDW8113931.1 hypothetical protein [candidate division WOR-3 bacterium]
MKKWFFCILIMLFLIPPFLNGEKRIRVYGKDGVIIHPDGTVEICPTTAPIVCADIIVQNVSEPEIWEAMLETHECNDVCKKYWAIFSEPLPTDISEINGCDVKIFKLIPLEE